MFIRGVFFVGEAERHMSAGILEISDLEKATETDSEVLEMNSSYPSDHEYIASVMPFENSYLFVMNDKEHDERVVMTFPGNSTEIQEKAYKICDILNSDNEIAKNFFDKNRGSWLICSRQGADNLVDDILSHTGEEHIDCPDHTYLIGRRGCSKNGFSTVYIRNGIPQHAEFIADKNTGDSLKHLLSNQPSYVSALFRRYNGKGPVPVSKLVRESESDSELSFLGYHLMSQNIINQLRQD